MRRSPRPRGGYTLVEMIVVISVMSILMSSALAMIVTLFQSQRTQSERLLLTHSLGRLGASLRRDVAEADRAELRTEAGRTALELTAGTGSVEYLVEADQVRRLVRSGGNSTGGDAFRLPRSAARFEPAPSPEGQVVLRVTRAASPAAGVRTEPVAEIAIKASPRAWKPEPSAPPEETP